MDTMSSKFTFAACVETFQDFVERRQSVNSSPKQDLSVGKPEVAVEEVVKTPYQPKPIISPEYEDMLKTLKPEERAFLNETMEGRNKILNQSSNLTKLISPDDQTPKFNAKERATIHESKHIKIYI